MDTHSTYTVAILATLANGTLLFAIRHQLVAHTLAAAQAWLVSTVAIVAGILSFMLPGLMPSYLDLLIPNGLIIAGLMGYAIALRRFHQRPVHTTRLLLLLVMACTGVLVFQWGWNDIRIRVLFVSVAWLYIMGDSLLTLWRGRTPSSSPARLALIALYALVLTGTALRLAYFLFFPVSPSMRITDGDNWVNRMTPVLAILLPAAGTSAFMLMCYHRQYRLARQQALTDPLTGLGNRALLASLSAHDHSLGIAPRTAFTAVLLIDLDDFKIINDTHGHATGDAVLVDVAQRLLSLSTPSDVVLRLGGDEFAILLGGERSPAAIQAMAQHIPAVLAGNYGTRIQLGASVGVAMAADPRHPPDLPSLIDQADQAMYAAKRQGRNLSLA